MALPTPLIFLDLFVMLLALPQLSADLMLLHAALYSFGAIRPLRAGIKAPNAYWDRRLLHNLLLANIGLYFTALFTLIGAFLARTTPGAAQPVLLLSIIVCLYSGVSVPLLTPRDWPHTLPRVLAAVSSAMCWSVSGQSMSAV